MDFDVIHARPLSIVPRSIEETSKPKRKLADFIFSATLVNRVFLAKTRRTRFCTDDINLSLFDVDDSSLFKPYEIFVNEALLKERYRLFFISKSAAKGLGIKYVWHRGGRFMPRARRRKRIHVFDSLLDLQTIQSATRDKILRPVDCNAPGAFEAGEPRPIVLGRGSFASEDQ